MRTRISAWGSRHRGAVWGAVLVTFALAGPVGATSGAMLHLGVSNTSNASTTLKGTTAAPELTVSNASTSSAARAISATSNSSAGTIYSRNNGTGPALSVSVPAGRAPIAVSSGAAKVANLDADKLDGLSSNALGQTYSASRASTPGSARTLVLSTPGFFDVYHTCRSEGTGSDVVEIAYPAGVTIFISEQSSTAGGGGGATYWYPSHGSGATIRQYQAVSAGGIATMTLSHWRAYGGTCYVIVQSTVDRP